MAGPTKKLSLVDAKAKVLADVAAGVRVVDAMAGVDRSVKTYETWRREDKEFAKAVDDVRAARVSAKNRGVDENNASMDFVTWRKEFLGYETYPHQQQWIDVLEGREPVPMDGCEWDPRNPNRLVVNVPPAHSKSQTITVDYSTYRICMNPNVRIVIVSKRAEQATKFLYQIQQRLTSPRFAKLQAAYAPPGGFRPGRGEGSFAQKVMYVAGRTADHKDPTVEVLGLRAQIYGTRADLIILDDVIVGENANEFEKQVYWLESEVESRIKGGKILIIGTRLASQDLYSELRNDNRYLSGRSPWSYLRQPMVLSFAENPKDWVTLWPKSTTPHDEADEPGEDGLYTMFDGPAAARIRDDKPPAVWSLVYQQQQIADDATFKPICVFGSVDARRKPGPLTAGAWGHPARGKEGMFTIAAMDPAMSGETFTLVGSVDKRDNKRWIENAWVQAAPPASYFREHIKQVTQEYKVNEWVIEEQGFQGFLVHDPEITRWLANRGVRIHGHYTGKQKLDPDFGVASMAPLFGTTRRINDGAGREVFDRDSNLIELPDQDYSQGIKTLIEELLTWVPGKQGKRLRQDGPMALWFFESRARQVLGVDRPGGEQKFVKMPWQTRGVTQAQAKPPFAWGVTRKVTGYNGR